MKVLSLFSGIGAFEKALTNMGVKYELVNYCEIDKYASKSYSAIHNVPESKNLGDITKVDTSKLPNNIDLLTYGFPCQDISLAGHQRGFEHEGERTRSGLFFEALRLIEDLQPKFAICENVKNLTSKKFEKEFSIVLNSLEEAGYKNYWKVLNAKDYGIPQNRERVFIISVREDIDKGYDFPEPFDLELRLKDMLDDVVDEKYYLSEKLIAGFSKHNDNHNAKGTGFIWKPKTGDEVANCLRANGSLAPTDNTLIVNESKVMKIGNLSEKNTQSRSVYNPNGVSPTLCAGMDHGNTMPHITIKEATKQGYTEAYEGDSINLEQPNSKTRRGRVGRGVAQTLTTSPQQAIVEPKWNKNKNVSLDTYVEMAIENGCELPCAVDEQNVTVNTKGTVGSLTTNGSSAKRNNRVIEPTLRIRKLTPKECFRLMGFDDEDFYKAEKVNSNTQLYKQAGNSIVVDVIEELYEQLFKTYWDEVR